MHEIKSSKFSDLFQCATASKHHGKFSLTLNVLLTFNRSAENLSRLICVQVEHCYRVEVQDSEVNMSAYERD